MNGRRRAERRVRASARPGRRGRRAERRLFAAVDRGDPAARDGVAAIARTPDHRLCEPAKRYVAHWWARTRDDELRRIVLETGALAPGHPARLLTLALLDRLDEWPPEEAVRAPDLLADPDPDVRDRAAAACRTATGPLHEALWRTGPAPGTPLHAALLASAEPPPDGNLDALWRLWLAHPDPDRGDALVRWGRPASDPELTATTVVVLSRDRDVLLAPANRRALLAALDRDDHPIVDIAVDRIAELDAPGLVDELCERALDRPALVPHCLRRGFVPRDPARRAVFHLVTGEVGQYRSLDPDGGLLALAYAAASKAERARIREALPATGDLDLVRVIVGDDRRARLREMPDEEARYLAEQLARRGEWEELWSFVQDVPIALGVELFRLFRPLGEWAPRDDAGRRLFGVFRETPFHEVERALQEIERPRRTVAHRSRTAFDGPVTDVSFSPDGRFLAVAHRTIDVLDVRAGRTVRRHDGLDAPAAVLHLGDGTVVAGDASRLVRCTERDVETLHAGPVVSLARTRGGGFVAALRTGEVLGDGADVLYRTPSDDPPRTVAADLGTGRLAVAGRRLRLYAPESGSKFSYDRGGRVADIAFAAPDLLVCGYDRGEVTVLPLSGGSLLGAPSTRVEGLAGVGALPGTGEPLVVDGRGDLHILGARNLRTIGGRRAPEPASPTCLAVSPRESLAAIGDAGGHVDLLDLADHRAKAPDLAHRPMADMLPRHLAPLDAVAADPALGPEATALLRLVRACLEHRFRFDVELGEATRLPATEHDIGL
ncbi:hypothetical protein [Actinomadura algeriensis]|uniref:WD40 repeat domain-containing protein n=1 Tax=Actinomadura algeriensis TaxID=1679523 RepID=A0ABR9JJ30_9ACTN|nr:hypothetical protein [Actinomadura algeriensis]MBE1530554.1 hypothetical protein [Actinomadura algeriensis]